MCSKAKEKAVPKAFGGFNYHKYSVPIIILTIATLFFCAYIFSFERPMWIFTCISLVSGITYMAGLEGTPESRQVADYMHYLDCQTFRYLHRGFKSRKLDVVSKSYIKIHMDEKYPDWDDSPNKKRAAKSTVASFDEYKPGRVKRSPKLKDESVKLNSRRPIMAAA